MTIFGYEECGVDEVLLACFFIYFGHTPQFRRIRLQNTDIRLITQSTFQLLLIPGQFEEIYDITLGFHVFEPTENHHCPPHYDCFLSVVRENDLFYDQEL